VLRDMDKQPDHKVSPEHKVSMRNIRILETDVERIKTYGVMGDTYASVVTRILDDFEYYRHGEDIKAKDARSKHSSQ